MSITESSLLEGFENQFGCRSGLGAPGHAPAHRISECLQKRHRAAPGHCCSNDTFDYGVRLRGRRLGSKLQAEGGGKRGRKQKLNKIHRFCSPTAKTVPGLYSAAQREVSQVPYFFIQELRSLNHDQHVKDDKFYEVLQANNHPPQR